MNIMKMIIFTRWSAITIASLYLLVACSGAGSSGTDTPSPAPIPAGPIQFHCAKDASCPEVLVEGDQFARLGADVAPFRGYGDPSLAYDPVTRALWMTYSWLDVLVTDPGPPAVINFGVRTHLARSIDGGASFTFQRDVNNVQAISHPGTGEMGWLIHEVSTLVKQPDGLWQALWLQYFVPLGSPISARGDFQYNRSIDTEPALLGMNSEPWARGSTTTAFGAPLNLSDIPELSNCAVFTEPALFSFNNSTYLATSCLVIEGNQRRTDLERLVLLREKPGGYDFVATLLDSDDAASFNADVLEQADLSIARDGEVLLLVTPIVHTDDPQHQGCRVFSFDDFTTGHLRRDANDVPISRAVITADGNGLGPGLCTYNANSKTGVLLVITTILENPVDIEFSLRATGVHP